MQQWRAFAFNPIKMGHRHDGSLAEVTKAIWKLGLLYERVLPNFYLRRDKRLIADETSNSFSGASSHVTATQPWSSMTAIRKVANHLGLLYNIKDDKARTTGTDYDPKSQVTDAFEPANCGKWQILEKLLVEWRLDAAAANKGKRTAGAL
ncbi:hypothetical protein Q5752_004634 [Cryptotrichosporon argae]